MRTIALVVMVLSVFVWSCNDSSAPQDPSVGDLLPSVTFTIDPSKDTVLQTPGGAHIRIPAGTFEGGDATAVQLEIKEAYDPTDMLRGRLVHASGDELSSGGIIYVNVAAGQNVSIHNAFTVSIPARDPQPDMMVYKGEAGDSGAVRWVEPRSLQGAPASADGSGEGKTLFESRCASCHHLRDESIAPPVAWITQRRDRQWLYAFTRNNATLLWRGDGYSCFLFSKYKAVMPLFKDLTDADLANLYHYIASASRAIDSNSVVDHRRTFDSCLHNDPNCLNAVSRSTASAPSADSTSTATAASDADGAAYYTFTVDKHGWYNVARKSTGAGAAASSSATSPSASPSTDSAIVATASTDPVASTTAPSCPCWCNEAAYRRADSLGRTRK